MEELQPNTAVDAKPTRRRLGLWFLVPLVLGLIALEVLSLEWRDSLRIRKEVVEGARIIPAQMIFALAKVQLKSSMYDVDIREVQQRILAQPFVKSATVNRQFPDGLHIRVEEREPIASLSGSQLRYVDADGVLLPYVQTSVQFDLPMISGIPTIEKAQVGDTISNKELFEAIGILQTAIAVDSAVYRMISEINMNNGDDVVLYSSDLGLPIILGRGDVVRKLLMLQSFWNNIVKSDGAEKLRYADLRFEGQLVVKGQQTMENESTKRSL